MKMNFGKTLFKDSAKFILTDTLLLTVSRVTGGIYFADLFG